MSTGLLMTRRPVRPTVSSMGTHNTTRASTVRHHQPVLRAAVAVLLLVVSIVAAGIFHPGRAFAAVPTIAGPARVFMDPDLPLPLAFTGVDLIAAPQQKLITVDVTDAATCDTKATPNPVYTGCAHIDLNVNHGLLKLTADDGMSTAGDPVAGGAALQFSGTKAQLNAALATMTFTPDSNYTNLADTPAILLVNATNGLAPFESTHDGAGTTKNIEIRVAKLNGFPTMTDPPSPQNVAASSDTTFTGNAFVASDPDVDSNGEHGKMLFIAWVTCGTFDVSPSGNFTLMNDLKTLLTSAGGIDPAVVDAAYALLPDSVKNLMFETATSGVKAIAGIGTLNDVNLAYSTLTFHAPAVPSSCTLTNFLSDLGNHGLPGHYLNFTMIPGALPTGAELPAFGFSIPTPAVTFVVDGGAVPTVTVEQASAQPDPTSTAPIHFTATFDMPVSGFDTAASDVVLSGTAGPSTALITPTADPAVFDIAVTGMTQSGTVIASVPAGAATAVVAPQNANTVSLSIDNIVDYQTKPATVVSLHAGQPASTSTSPIVFDATFSEPVENFVSADVTLGGTAGATTAVVAGSGATYTVTVTGMPVTGTVTATVGAGVADALATLHLTNLASNTSTVNYTVPLASQPTVVVSLHAGQAASTTIAPIVFDVTFSESVDNFVATDLTLGGTAGANNVVLSGSGASYVATVTGMTTTGTVDASVLANVATATAPPNGSNVASNVAEVSFTIPIVAVPAVTMNQGVAQVDPTSVSPVVFDVVFSEVVTGFDASDVVLGGTAGASVVVVSGSGAVYAVSVSGMTQSGTVVASVAAGAAVNAALTASAASTSTDNTVTYNMPVQGLPLTITVPADKTVPNDPGKAGAAVTFAAATASGGTPPITISCSRVSGDFFVLGPTVVSCTATDSFQAELVRGAVQRANVIQPNAVSVSASFTITVVDTELPTVAHPDVTVHTKNPAGVVVSYGPPSAADNSGVAPIVSCAPATGVNYVIGTTPVTCTATDAAANTASVTFNVIVILDPTPLPATGNDSVESLRLAASFGAAGMGLLIIARRRKIRAG
jgi:HYR domain